jgi:hypothetical protein
MLTYKAVFRFDLHRRAWTVPLGGVCLADASFRPRQARLERPARLGILGLRHMPGRPFAAANGPLRKRLFGWKIRQLTTQRSGQKMTVAAG